MGIRLVTIGVVTIVYLVAAQLGLSLAVAHRNVSLVWPPTGIALAAILLFGYRLWPAVFLGALFANLLTHIGFLASLGIAIGNTLEALVGVFLLRRLLGFDTHLKRLKDTLGLIGLAGLCATTLSATIGVTTLCLADNHLWEQYGLLWVEWWLGDFLGALIVTPLLLVWSEPLKFSLTLARGIEAGFLSTVLVATATFIFGTGYQAAAGNYLYIFSVFPIVSWAAIRFGTRGATLSTFILSGIAIWGTARGHGPFAADRLDQGLLYLQIFMAVVVSTALVLSASMSERNRAEEALQKTNRDLRRLNERRAEFTSIISHELRTPLFSIKEGIQQVLDGIEGELAPGQRENLTLVMSNVERLARLTSKVLDVSRLESGKMQMVFEATNVNGLITELFRLMQLDATSKGIALALNSPAYPVIARCDPDKIKQVVINLLSNAFKFTKAGGTVTLTLATSAQNVQIDVEDTGVGIKKEDQELIFETFSQGSLPLPLRVPGAGMGLRICKLMMALHGGSVSVKSAPGIGSKFTVLFPKERT